MLVRERMQALGDHAKSSRQPPLKERKYAQADESAADGDIIVRDELETAHESEAATVADVSVQADEFSAQIIPHENGDDGAAAQEVAQDAGGSATPESVAPNTAQPASAADVADVIDEDASAKKRGINHEWQNWSALHSDELNDPNVAEYFFRHLQTKKPQLLNFESQDQLAIVRKYMFD
ncbi:MAG: hypothetical protein ACM3OF_14155 [Gemmatimonas sp.]